MGIVLVLVTSLLLNFVLIYLLIDRKDSVPIYVHNSNDELFARCILLVEEQNQNQESGEYKRHQVYAQLIKEFPLTKRSEIAYCIEEVIQSLTQ
jgi:hypothetical protein